MGRAMAQAAARPCHLFEASPALSLSPTAASLCAAECLLLASRFFTCMMQTYGTRILNKIF